MMSDQIRVSATDEESLVKLYAELTGASECCARGVLMHLNIPGSDGTNTSHSAASGGDPGA
jgi:hypothetical protein